MTKKKHRIGGSHDVEGSSEEFCAQESEWALRRMEHSLREQVEAELI